MHLFILTNKPLLFIELNNCMWHPAFKQTPGVYFIYSAAIPSVYLSPGMYMSPALIRINTVYTDHNPLVKNHNQRLLQWSLALQEYDLEIADALSRAI